MTEPLPALITLRMKLIKCGGGRPAAQRGALRPPLPTPHPTPTHAPFFDVVVFVCCAAPSFEYHTAEGSCSATRCAFVAVIKAGVAQGCVC